MQKRNYKNFNEEQQVQIQYYPTGIPIGQPINQQEPYQQNIPQQNFQPMPQQHQQMPQQYQQMPPNQFPPQNPYNVPVFNMAPQMPPTAATTMQGYNFPIQAQCPCCKMLVPTVVNQESGNTTYLWCGFLACFVSPMCCCLPFLMDSCLDKSHYCPNCGHNILRKHQRCFQFMGC